MSDKEIMDSQKKNNSPFAVTRKGFNSNMGKYELYIHKLGDPDNTTWLELYKNEPQVSVGDMLQEIPTE